MVDILLTAGLVALLFGPFVWRMLHTGDQVAELTLPNGHSYTYLVGDYMTLYGRGGWFHGVDVSLPKEMPHIYLDSLRGGGRRLPYVIDTSQLVRLEGNFNKEYRVFVPKHYEYLALSILSPDVMATLQDYATAFDVEIYGSHVRIISNRRVLRNQSLRQAAVEVATQVMREIDQRLQSWDKADSLNAVNTELLVYPEAGVRLFGRSIRFSFLVWTLYWLVVTICLGAVGLLAYSYPELRSFGIGLMVFFVCLFAALLIVTKRDSKKSRFGSRH